MSSQNFFFDLGIKVMLRFGIAFRFMIFVFKNKARDFKYVSTLVLCPLSLDLTLYFSISCC